jgi:hypothetical protein
MWKRMVMAYFEVMSWLLPGGTEKSHKNPVRLDSLWAELSTQDLLNMNASHLSLRFGVYVMVLCPLLYI